METTETAFGVCVWQFPDGSYLMDREQNHFCAQGRPYDPIVEYKLTQEVLGMGIEEGKAFWLPGFRKITGNEWEDQMAALQDGEVPDAVDAYRQDKYGN